MNFLMLRLNRREQRALVRKCEPSAVCWLLAWHSGRKQSLCQCAAGSGVLCCLRGRFSYDVCITRTFLLPLFAHVTQAGSSARRFLAQLSFPWELLSLLSPLKSCWKNCGIIQTWAGFNLAQLCLKQGWHFEGMQYFSDATAFEVAFMRHVLWGKAPHF